MHRLGYINPYVSFFVFSPPPFFLQATDEICNLAQVATIVGGLDFILQQRADEAKIAKKASSP